MYFLQFVVQRFANPEAGITRLILLSQFCFVLPTLVFALVAARRPLRALRVTLPAGESWWKVACQCLLAILLAISLHPLGVELGKLLEPVFPVSDEVKRLLADLFKDVSIGKALLLMAVVPAVVEEFAFRGVVLSGLRTRVSAFAAVLISAAAFGFAHTFLAQSVSTSLLGVVLGMIAIKSGHILPCIGFHLSYNGLHLLRVAYSDELRNLTARTPVFRWLFELSGETEVGYTPIMVVAASLISLLLLVLVWQLGRHDNHRASPWRNLEAEPRGMITQSPAEESGA
jgi:sodium transport system permease protein